ncbi:MAG TPA: hypothetical protein VHE80_09145 [Acidimicrobiales bacterium]|nr:hypothetical protein [Acidimicrobiales bacterium]
MADDWVLEHRDGKQAVMLALHRSDVADLNRRARARLRAFGALGDPVLRLDGVYFAVGDRVMALRNYRRIGLLNGTRATVEGGRAMTWSWRPTKAGGFRCRVSICSTATWSTPTPSRCTRAKA